MEDILLVIPRAVLYGGFHPRETWLIFQVATSLQVTNIFVTAHIMVPRDLLLDETVPPCPNLGPMEGDTSSDCPFTVSVRCAHCYRQSGHLLCALVLLLLMGCEEGLCWQYTLCLHVLLGDEL